MKKLVEKLEKGDFFNKSLERAFLKIRRDDFLPEEVKHLSQEDKPLPIGSGQTNSQPSVVAFMLNKLDLRKGQKVLDIGSGSGWTTALLAELVGKEGRVVAIERIPELYEFGKKNVNKYNFLTEGRVEMICSDGSKGLPEEAPFDRILVSASLKDNIPDSWIEQLGDRSVLLVPIQDSIYKYTKKEGQINRTKFFGFSFVPLIKDNE